MIACRRLFRAVMQRKLKTFASRLADVDHLAARSKRVFAVRKGKAKELATLSKL